eukprot:UN30264
MIKIQTVTHQNFSCFPSMHLLSLGLFDLFLILHIRKVSQHGRTNFHQVDPHQRHVHANISRRHHCSTEVLFFVPYFLQKFLYHFHEDIGIHLLSNSLYHDYPTPESNQCSRLQYADTAILIYQ